MRRRNRSARRVGVSPTGDRRIDQIARREQV